MKILKASKIHTCKRCRGDINKGDQYYPQRRRQAICLECGKSGVRNEFIN